MTLAAENLLWLRGQVRAAGGRSVSEMLDRLISEARAQGRVHSASIRSVTSTIGIAESDPELEEADAAIRALFPKPPIRVAKRRTRTARRRG